jgi:glycosyltransferase involved in cell wall biosynthesis
MSGATMSEPTMSIIMPALNEEANIRDAIGDTLTAFDDFGIAGEIVVINDGSTDRTGELVAEVMAAEPRVRVVTHEKPYGIGASFWDGVKHARGEHVVMLPGDNENDPWEILQYHRLLEHVDILVPFVFNKQVRSLFRNALSFFYRFIINTTFLVYFNYTNGTVVYRRKILEELDFHSQGFFFQTDILVRLVKRGYLFAEVPYRLNARANGVSKAVSFPSFLRVARGYLRLVQDIYFDAKGKLSRDYAAGSQTARRYAASVAVPQP